MEVDGRDVEVLVGLLMRLKFRDVLVMFMGGYAFITTDVTIP